MKNKPFSILVPDVEYTDLDIERSITGSDATYQIYHETDPNKISDNVWANCDAVLVWHRMKIDALVVAKLENCRLIVRVGVGFDNVDTQACSARGIPVANVPNYGTTEVADHAMALLLNLVRGVSVYQEKMRQDPVAGFRAEGAPVVRRIRGSTFGAVGLGRIGHAIARRARAFDQHVVFYDPYLSEGSDLAFGFERVRSLTDLLERSDVVSLHTPLTTETRLMIDAVAFERMKPDSILINVARGALVDLEALYDALRVGRLAAAGLDVIQEEPPVSRWRLLDAWQRREPWLEGRLSITPHAAFYSRAGYLDMRTFSAQILKAWLVDGFLRNNVNPDWSQR